MYETLKYYIEKTAALRKDSRQEDSKPLIRYIKPYRPVSKDTIANWIKKMLNISGVDTTKFTAGSIRSAAASRTKAKALPVNYILARAGWS